MNSFSIKDEINKIHKAYASDIKHIMTLQSIESELNKIFRISSKYDDKFSIYFLRYSIGICISLEKKGKLKDVLFFLEEAGIDTNNITQPYDGSSTYYIHTSLFRINIETNRSNFCKLEDDHSKQEKIYKYYPKKLVCEE